MVTSSIAGEEVTIVKQAPGILYDGGNPLASAEFYVVIDIPNKSAPDSSSNVPMRGIEPLALQVRDEASLIQGRVFRFGTNEVIVKINADRTTNSRWTITVKEHSERAVTMRPKVLTWAPAAAA